MIRESWFRSLLTGFLVSGCSLVSEIDVCERSPAEERAANGRVEGDQTTHVDSLAAMPGGGAFVAFVSELSAEGGDERTEIRGVLLDPQGGPQPTNGATTEQTYAPATVAPGAFELHQEPMVVPPDDEDGIGVVVYDAIDEESSQIEAVFISASGAPFARSIELATTVISEAEGPTCNLVREPPFRPARCALSPVAVPLGPTRDTESDRDFAFIWASYSADEFTGLTATLRGRLLRAHYSLQEPRNARDELEPVSVELAARASIVDLTAVGLDDGHIMVLWTESEVGRALRVQAMILDRFLNEIVAPTEVARGVDGRESFPDIAAARSGDRVLVVWNDVAVDGRERVRARATSQRAEPLGPIVDVSASAGTQSEPSVTALAERPGFAVAWTAADDPADEDASGSGIRMALVDELGMPRFANPACDAEEFQANPETEGPQRRPSLATLSDGTVIGVWTGTDISGTGLRSTAWTPRALLPIEE